MRRGYSISSFLFLMLLSFPVRSQDRSIIDSLISVVEENEHDTLVCGAYLRWGEQIYLSNPDTALILWRNAHTIAGRNIAANPHPTLERTFLAFLADAFNNIGTIYYQKGDIPNALEYYHKCLRIDEKTSNSSDLATAKIGRAGVAISLNNIASIYNDQGDQKKALEFYHKSLKMQKEIVSASDVSSVNVKNAIAICLNNIAGIHDDQGDIENALKYHEQSLGIQQEIGNKKGIATSLNNTGYIYEHKGDIALALEYYNRSLSMRRELGNKAGIAVCLINVAHIEINQGKLDEAWANGQDGLELARELGNAYLISRASNILSGVAKLRGDFKEALSLYEVHIQMRDSINNEATQKASIRQQTKYEFEKAQLVKEQEEKEQTRRENEATSRRDNLQYSVILLGLLILGTLILLALQKRSGGGGLGKLALPPRMAEGLIFFSFLILFEFLLVLADPYIEGWSGGGPGLKLLFNAGIAAFIFPLHAFFETKLKKRLSR